MTETNEDQVLEKAASVQGSTAASEHGEGDRSEKGEGDETATEEANALSKELEKIKVKMPTMKVYV